MAKRKIKASDYGLHQEMPAQCATVKRVSSRAFSFPKPAQRVQWGVVRCECCPRPAEYATAYLTMKTAKGHEELVVCRRHLEAALLLEKWLDVRDQNTAAELAPENN